MSKRHVHITAGILVLGLSVVGCEEPTDSQDASPSALEQDEEDGMLQGDEVFVALDASTQLDEVDHGDGTFSFALPEGESLAEGTLVRDGALVWRYEGQERFDIEQERPLSTVRRVQVREESRRTLEEQLFAMERVDDHGRRWVIEDFDRAAIEDLVRAYDEESDEAPDSPDEARMGEAVANEEDPAVGTWVELTPESWDHVLCPAEGLSGDITTHVWDDEDREHVHSSHTHQEKAAVKIVVFRAFSDGDQESHCSGTMIDDRHVLTAAHCVSNIHNFSQPTNRVRVCHDETGDCTTNYIGNTGFPLPTGFSVPSSGARSVTAIDRAPGYTGADGTSGGTDFDDDWAIITLSGSFSSHSLRLSGASDSRILGLTRSRSFGYPGQRTDGSSSGCTETLFALQSLEEMESPTSTTTKKVRHRVDNTAGQSGAPFYYCPHLDDSRCNQHPTETGFVYGVHAGWNSFNKRVVGPKVPNFRATALALID